MFFFICLTILAIINIRRQKRIQAIGLLQLQQNYRRTTFVEKTGGQMLAVNVKYLKGDIVKVSW